MTQPAFSSSPTGAHPGVARQDLQRAFDALLQPERFKDYGPNGLQVEGRAQIKRLVSGVTASRALIDAAIEQRADAQALARHVEAALGRPVTLVQAEPRPITRVAWCTGGAQGYFEAAIATGADAFITGEISEPQAHIARETGVAFIAAGHHATERYGAPAVAARVAEQFSLEHVFIDIDNPA